MKLVNGGGGGGGGGGGSSGVGGGGGGEKTAFSFKKCSAFQFVKRKVSLDNKQHFGGGASLCLHMSCILAVRGGDTEPECVCVCVCANQR